MIKLSGVRKLDISLVVVIVLLAGIFRSDYVFLTVFLLILPYIYLTNRKKFIPHYLLAIAVGIVWMTVGHGQYGYNQDYLNVLGFNAYPLFGWPIGLFGMYLIYIHVRRYIKHNKLVYQLGLYSIIYWILLLAGETVFYHVFNVHNEATAQYIGLPICDCLHAPAWMQLVYFSLGPLYFIIIKLLRLDHQSE